MTDLGKNNGVTGIITLAGGTAPFNGQVEAWDSSLANAIINRAGPGTNGPSVRCETGTGSMDINSTVNKKGFPIPSSLEKVSGTVTLQWTTAVTAVIPIMVTGVGLSGSAKKNQWNLNIKAAINGVPVLAGWDGTQVAGSATFADQSLWSGRQKSYDPAELNHADYETIDVSVPTTPATTGSQADAIDLAKIASAIAAAVPTRAGMKVVFASIARTGALGARVSLQWGYHNSADRIVKGSEADTTDPAGINNSAVRAVVHLSSGSATAPDTPAGLKLVNQSTQPITGSLKSVTVFQYGIDDSADRITNGQRRDIVDPDGLRSESTIALIHAATDPQPAAPSAPVAGLKIVSTSEAVINNANSLTTFRYGLRTIKEQIENDGTTWSYSTSLAENGRQETVIEHYTGSFETWRTTYKDTFYVDSEARSIIFRRFTWSGTEGESDAGTVFVTKVYRAQTSSVDFMGPYKVEPGATMAYTENRGVYLDGSTYKVFVMSNTGTSVSNRIVRFGMGVSGVRSSFYIIRQATGEAPPDFASLVGKTNSGAFLGIPAGLVRYAMSTPKQMPKQMPPTVYTRTYLMVADTNGHIDRFGAVRAGDVPYNSASPASGGTVSIGSNPDVFPYVKIAPSADLSPLIAST